MPVLLLCLSRGGSRAQVDGDWPSVGRDPGGQRFSPLTQVTPRNVARLQQVWALDTGQSNLQVTPLVIGGRMYLTAGSTGFALESETGTVIWKYEAPGAVSQRGLACWPGDPNTAPRLFSGAGDGRMVAIEARTGQPAAGFGDGGFVDLNHVNSATDEDLTRVLDISPAQASAIVEYRNHEGALRSLGDVQKIPGIDAADLTRKQDRIVFGDK